MNRYQSFRAYLIYRRAAAMAEKAHKKEGGRYFVLPCASEKRFLIVTDRKNFRILQRKHYIDSGWNLDDVRNRAFYYTADRGGNNAPTDEVLKTRQFIYQYWFGVRIEEIRLARKGRRIAFLKSLTPFGHKGR